jgi:hypothetical protein
LKKKLITWFVLSIVLVTVMVVSIPNVVFSANLPQAIWFTFNGFTTYINDAQIHYQSSAWMKLYQPIIAYKSIKGHVLSTDINLTADGINVFIPAGTEVTVPNTGIPMLDNLGIQYVGGVLTFFTQNMAFSNPVIITDANGKVLASFTSITNGKPSNSQPIEN